MGGELENDDLRDCLWLSGFAMNRVHQRRDGDSGSLHQGQQYENEEAAHLRTLHLRLSPLDFERSDRHYRLGARRRNSRIQIANYQTTDDKKRMFGLGHERRLVISDIDN